MEKLNIGIQLYSLREEMEKDMDATLKKVAEMGYDCVEFAGFCGKSASEVKALCEKYNLNPISVHQSIDPYLEEESAKQMVAYLKEVGVKHSVVPWMDKTVFHDEQKYAQFVAQLKKTGEFLKENGITLGYHNHDFEFEKEGGEYILDRLYTDAIAFEPDIISILIGINDIWHRYGGGKVATTDAQIELNYRSILERLRRETNAKIVILSPYLLKRESTDADAVREDLKTVLTIVRKLADEFADVYIPLDEHFAVAEPLSEPYFYSNDGVHPNANGAEFIGKLYADAVKPLIEEI